MNRFDRKRVRDAVARVLFGQGRRFQRPQAVVEAVVCRVEPDDRFGFAIHVDLDKIGVEDHAVLHRRVVQNDRARVVLRIGGRHLAEAVFFEIRACGAVQALALLIARRIVPAARRDAHEIIELPAALGQRDAQLSPAVVCGKIVGDDRPLGASVKVQGTVGKQFACKTRCLRFVDRIAS